MVNGEQMLLLLPNPETVSRFICSHLWLQSKLIIVITFENHGLLKEINLAISVARIGKCNLLDYSNQFLSSSIPQFLRSYKLQANTLMSGAYFLSFFACIVNLSDINSDKTFYIFSESLIKMWNFFPHRENLQKQKKNVLIYILYNNVGVMKYWFLQNIDINKIPI